jgi:hypothetical protein
VLSRFLVPILLLMVNVGFTGCGPSKNGSAPQAIPVGGTRIKLENNLVDEDHYARVKVGMKLDEVVEVLGAFSGSTVSTEQSSKDGIWYLWEDERGGMRKVILARILEGILVEKKREGF